MAPVEKVNALEILNHLGTKSEKVKSTTKSKKTPKKRKKRSIIVFDEKKVTNLSLKFLNKRFEFQVKSVPKVSQSYFFNTLIKKINRVQLTESKIHFCNNSDKLVSVNFKPMKNKYKELMFAALKNKTIGIDGVISDPKLISEIMVICQSCYVKGNDDDRKNMIDRSTTAKSSSGKMGESAHFLNQ